MRAAFCSLLLALTATSLLANDPPPTPASFDAGFARIDITPKQPLRLSGYASRTTPFERIESPIYTRAAALRANDGDIYVLVSVDTIGPPGSITDKVCQRVESELGITRRRIVFCGSHSHATPHLTSGLTNLFSVPLTPEEQTAAAAYETRFTNALFDVTKQAIDNLAPAKVSFGQGAVGFAMNRRGNRPADDQPPPVPPRGPVDHSVPILKITDPDGKLRGVVFNYACHATTIGQNFVDGDWPGYASRDLEEAHEDIVALCTIGCGADANPAPRGGDHPELHAQAHGRALAMEVGKLLKQELTPLTSPPVGTYGFAGLPIDRPTVADLEAQLATGSVQEKNRAQYYLDLLKRMDRLPESFPMPVEGWKFGDQLTMVFLGGEVVVDYTLRLKKELESDLVWVSAYSNDVFAYVASERVRSEGGYEVDSSMIYYNQPGRWSSGTEEIVIQRIHELLNNPGGEEALKPEDAKQSLYVPDGFDVDLIASEPLIEDPVNMAFGPDGRLWVVEMRDYPRGEDGQGAPGGRVKVLSDTNQDGVYDKADMFLDGLAYPNGVIPWRDGAFVSCAPDIFFAKDTNGDGTADTREVFFTGFPEANPQHRVNGFSWGLDGFLYLTHGAAGISSPKTGKEYNLAGRDFAFHPDTGELITLSGDSQFGRARDEWGTWFANTNTQPIFHYVTEDHWLARNPYVTLPSPRRQIIPAEAYRVWPDSRVVDRFNDLRSESRFTSACGPTYFLAPGFSDTPIGFACEPVHNLVRGFQLNPDGLTYKGDILPVTRTHGPNSNNKDNEAVTDAETPAPPIEFFTSTDPWFRPVRATTGPDGGLWVADMYRLVIEHPQWIPESWQARLDLRGGADKGRIWRVRKSDQTPGPLPNLLNESTEQLVARLDDPNGVIRDLAQQVLTWKNDPQALPAIQQLVTTAKHPAGRLQALSTLATLNALDANTLLTALPDDDPHVVQFAVRLAGPLLNDHPELGEALLKLVSQTDERVRVQTAIALGEWDAPQAANGLIALAIGPDRTGWVRVAVQSSATAHADAILAALLEQNQTALAPAMVATLLGSAGDQGPQRVLEILQPHTDHVEPWQLTALTSVSQKASDETRPQLAQHTATQSGLTSAREILENAEASLNDKLIAARLLATPFGTSDDHEQLFELLNPQSAPELQEEIISALGTTGDVAIANELIGNWDTYAPRIRRGVLQAFLSQPSWTELLVDGLAEKTVRPADLDAAAREQLLATSNADLAARAAKLLDTAGDPSREAVVREYQSIQDLTGDAAQGRLVFEQTCATCHRLADIGKEFGPNLAALTDRSAEALLIAVLDPNRAVEAKYRGYTVVTTDGRVLAGLITSESTNAITLAGADGRTTELLRSDIEELRDSGKSFMPEGLERDLPPQKLADVLTFIRETAP